MFKSGYIFAFLTTILSCLSIQAQVDPLLFDNLSGSLRDSDLVYFDKGRKAVEAENYLEAIPYFERVLQNNPNQKIQYLTGICYAYNIRQTDRSIPLIRKAESEALKIKGYHFNLAYALERNDSTERAIEKYLLAFNEEQNEHSGNTELAKEIQLRIDRCKKILEYKNKQSLVKITNIGKPINTDAAEYCPLITSNESIMIYTYRGIKSKGGKQKIKTAKKGSNDLSIFFEDILMSTKINDTTWSEPAPIENLNTNLHDAAVSLSQDGTKLFIYKNNGAGMGDLYMSVLNGTTFTKPVYQAGLNSHEWDGSACFLPYQDKIIFASERKGGFGGKDLYSAERIKENTWGNIKNLGPTINSKFDEDAPFVTTDGKILFFCSNNSSSIGGYDVFRSDLKNNEWQAPFNLGPPLNTKNDDEFFTVRADGKVGYYSSVKAGGKGEQDIYRIEPGIPGKPVELLEVNGLVTIDGKPVAAEVEIHSVLQFHQFNIKSTAREKDGMFITNLPAGDKFEITVKVDKFPHQMIELSTVGIDSFVVLNVYADFNSAEYDQKLKELVKANTITNTDATDIASLGSKQKDGLKYKIQIGAYKFFENFNYNNILGFPKIIRQTDNDHITRFVMGDFNTYNEAAELLKKIRSTGVLKDAFIIAYYKGERKYLSQLISEKIMD